jgi:hypothetical protein
MLYIEFLNLAASTMFSTLHLLYYNDVVSSKCVLVPVRFTASITSSTGTTLGAIQAMRLRL